MSSLRSHRIDAPEEIVTDWRIVATGGGIALFGLVAGAITILWLYLTTPPLSPQPEVVAAGPKLFVAGDVEIRDKTPLVLNQPLVIPPRKRVIPQGEPAYTRPPEPDPVEEFVGPLPPEPERPPSLDAYPLRSKLSEASLLEMLEKVPQVDLAEQATAMRMIADLTSTAKLGTVAAEVAKLHESPELQGLPFRKGKLCEISAEEAAYLRHGARQIRPWMPDLYGERPRSRYSTKADYYNDHYAARNYMLVDNAKVTEFLPALMQIVSAEQADDRLALVHTVGQSTDDRASKALAQRAVFDLDQRVRATAIDLLTKREGKNYRTELLAAFRYPWAPVADHAADALVLLNNRQVLPELVAMLDQPDPAAPYLNEQKKWVQPELVRINHLRNCLLCHAPDVPGSRNLTGLVPTPGEKIPVVYYSSRRGSFVRADITYLRQDFSAKFKMLDHGNWPEQQRYDFLIRRRELSEEEVKCRDLGSPRARNATHNYPQRDAVLHVLKRMLRVDAGPESEAWRQVLAQYPDLRR